MNTENLTDNTLSEQWIMPIQEQLYATWQNAMKTGSLHIKSEPNHEKAPDNPNLSSFY